MPQITVTNPNGAFVGVTDFRTGKDANGDALRGVQTVVDDYTSAGAIAVGDLVNLVPPASASVNWQWKQNAAAGADPITRQHGIALTKTTAAGQQVKVCVYGPVLCNVGAATPAVDVAGIRSATAGQVTTSATPDATTITGTIMGVFGGAKDANNQAILFVNQW